MSRNRPALSKREKEILDIVYARGHATAAEVRAAMQEPPTDAGVRKQDGPRYDYWPVISAEVARRSELQHVLRTFFGGSVESALSTLLDVKPGDLDEEERRRLKRLIDNAKKQGR
jgi:BlaI family transcriptional regulator, penicillinase repressor